MASHRNARQRLKFTGKWTVWLYSGIVIVGVYAYTAMTQDEVAMVEPIPRNTEKVTCVLEKIIDGDTLLGKCNGIRRKIRLLGIDAPEIAQKPWGARAKETLTMLMKPTFQLMPYGRDAYHRQLGIIWIGDVDINWSMIRSGMATAYRAQETPVNYTQAERAARAEHVGIWSTPGDQQNPKIWRRYHQ